VGDGDRWKGWGWDCGGGGRCVHACLRAGGWGGSAVWRWSYVNRRSKARRKGRRPRRRSNDGILYARRRRCFHSRKSARVYTPAAVRPNRAHPSRGRPASPNRRPPSWGQRTQGGRWRKGRVRTRRRPRAPRHVRRPSRQQSVVVVYPLPRCPFVRSSVRPSASSAWSPYTRTAYCPIPGDSVWSSLTNVHRSGSSCRFFPF